jgi:hypothetical protein
MACFKIIFTILLVFGFSKNYALAEELIQVPAAIQISSRVSDGTYTIPEIINVARNNGIKILILTDRDLMRWEYGLWPLRNVIKKTVEGNSIFKYGVKRYLKEIQTLQKKNSDLLLIPGIESAPFYYWKGAPFAERFKIMDWHKHIIAIGLDSPADLRNLPVAGNIRGLAMPFKIKNILNLWPLLVLAAGFIYFRRPKFDYKDFSGRQLSSPSKMNRIIGILLIFSGGILLFNNYPFCDLKFDQYRGDLGILPYQNFIDYVNEKGGVTFWAHPEAEYVTEDDGIGIETRVHTDYLLKAFGYTGFAMFYESYRRVAVPGGVWDKVLNEYCQGRRRVPIWVMGGLGFDTEDDLNKYLQDLRTIFLLPELNKEEVLSALKKGRMYIVRGKDSSGFTLDEFKVSDSTGPGEAIMGEEIELSGKPVIKIKGHFSDGKSASLKIKLIRDGDIINTIDVVTPFDIAYQDEPVLNKKRSYYRAEVVSENILTVVNPVFITRR